MKIAFHLNCLERGGAERVASILAGRFACDGQDVTVATEWTGEDEFSLDPEVRRVHVGLTAEDEKKGRLRKAMLRITRLRDFLREEKPDVVIAFDHNVDYRALMAAAPLGIPVIISIRTDPSASYTGLRDRILVPLLFKRAAGCVFQTREQKMFFAPLLQDNGTVILNPVHPKYPEKQKEIIAAPPEKEKIVIHCGRISRPKNQAMLIDAFMQVHEKHPDHILQIYGQDEKDGTRQILEKKIKDYGASAFIQIHGAVDDLEKILPKASVYAHTSDYEGLPNAIIEAMCMGLPVVSTDCPCGGPAELIDDGVNGLLVPKRDTAAAAEAICRLIEDPELAERLGREAMKITGRCSEEEVFGQWKAFLLAIAER
ncbi:MAG: glycosyltransferase [Lachnospiraceae bacterium]|nr:glycosyltransferase [Lachnospiraceae bacterium]